MRLRLRRTGITGPPMPPGTFPTPSTREEVLSLILKVAFKSSGERARLGRTYKVN
jgi:hypothetical protein